MCGASPRRPIPTLFWQTWSSHIRNQFCKISTRSIKGFCFVGWKFACSHRKAQWSLELSSAVDCCVHNTILDPLYVGRNHLLFIACKPRPISRLIKCRLWITCRWYCAVEQWTVLNCWCCLVSDQQTNYVVTILNSSTIRQVSVATCRIIYKLLCTTGVKNRFQWTETR